MELLSIILLSISLSMDTFSLALGYGTLKLSDARIKTLSLIVGMYHFIMPLIGVILGHFLGYYIAIDTRYLVFIIFMVIGIEMICNLFEKDKKIILLNNIGLFIFGFTVSIDSFSVGIGLEFISKNHLLCSSIFFLSSSLFTYLGLKLGNKLAQKFDFFAQLLGGLILIVFALYYLFK